MQDPDPWFVYPFLMQQPRLEGSEVCLRPLEVADAPALGAAATESRESYGFTDVPADSDGALRYIEQALDQRARGHRLPFAVEFQGRVVGTTSYYDFPTWSWPLGSDRQRSEEPDVVEVGYTWLAASAQRTRCNTEAKFLLFEHAFEQWKVHRVSVRTDARNTKCRVAIERLGAKLDGVVRADKVASDSSVRDSALYSIVLAEWPHVRDRLRERLREHLA